MENNNKDNGFQAEDFLTEDPLLLDEPITDMPELTLDEDPILDSGHFPTEEDGPADSLFDSFDPDDSLSEIEEVEEEDFSPEDYPDEPPLPASVLEDDLLLDDDFLDSFGQDDPEPVSEGFFTPESAEDFDSEPGEDDVPASDEAFSTDPQEDPDGATEDFLFDEEDSAVLPALTDEELDEFLSDDAADTDDGTWDAPEESEDEFMAPPASDADQDEKKSEKPRRKPQKKGRPKRKKGYGLFGLPHIAATFVWLAIIIAIGTSLGRMIWVCAADVLAFGRVSSQVSVTITTNDTIDDIARKLHEANLVKYPGLFKLYASIAVDDGEILPGTFQMNTLYDYHALVVQMGPRSSNRSVVEDVLIPEGLNCRQIFELLEEMEICTVKELEEYAANGEFTDFWFLEGVQRGDKYCLEGFLFPDTYDFYAHSTPREALGKMLLGFEAKFTQEVYDQLPALNERLSAMMRAKGCSEEHIANNQLDLQDLLIVASLIEEETASSKESPMIASVIFNRLTEDQVYERYLGIDAALIYATGDANNIDHSIDSPYNTRKNAGLPPTPISNPGMSSILAALNFESSDYYYYVLNPETQTHQFSKTIEEHEKWVNQFYPGNEG